MTEQELKSLCSFVWNSLMIRLKNSMSSTESNFGMSWKGSRFDMDFQMNQFHSDSMTIDSEALMHLLSISVSMNRLAWLLNYFGTIVPLLYQPCPCWIWHSDEKKENNLNLIELYFFNLNHSTYLIQIVILRKINQRHFNRWWFCQKILCRYGKLL